MNKRSDSLIGQEAAEKVGKGWALSTFQRQTWGTTKQETLTNVNQLSKPELRRAFGVFHIVLGTFWLSIRSLRMARSL